MNGFPRTTTYSLVLLLCLCAAGASGDTTGIADTTRPCPPSGLSVLIASDHGEISSFQQTVIARVEQALASAGHAVSRIDVAALDKANPSASNAIIVLNAIEADKLRRPVRDFVRKAADAELRERVLVSTVTGGDWTGKQARVHAITGASRNYSIDVVVRTIVKRVEAVLECEAPIAPVDSSDAAD